MTAALDSDRYIGQRVSTFRFRLVDGITNQNRGEITPLRDSVPTLTHDSTRTVVRTLEGLALGVADTARVDVIRDRVLVSMLIEGVGEFRLGRYMFMDQTSQRFTLGNLSTGFTWGSLSTTMLGDEMFVLDLPIDRGFSASLAAPGFAEHALRVFLQRYAIQAQIETSPFRSVGAWSVGTSGAQVIGSLAVDGDYFSPWFDHDGILRFVRAFDPVAQIPDLDFDAGNRVYAESIAETNDLISAPNRYVVISNGAENGDVPIVGTFDIPSSAPHSIGNRGFVVADVRDLQVASVEQARAIAANLGQRQQIFERTELTTAPDPRHDGHQVIRWLGRNWLEIGWSLELVEGGAMRHTLRRAYEQ